MSCYSCSSCRIALSRSHCAVVARACHMSDDAADLARRLSLPTAPRIERQTQVVYAWGRNDCSQLGSPASECEPVPLEVSTGQPVVAVSGALFHTAFLSGTLDALSTMCTVCGTV